MYGHRDIYQSPQSAFGDLFAEEAELYGAHAFDDFGDLDEDDDEYGILGIALTKKAREKKFNRKLDDLQRQYDDGKLDKASFERLKSQLDSSFGLYDDEYGILGIALTKAARQKKWNKRLASTLGKLKKLHEQNKLDKARKAAGKLEKIVTKLEKVEDGFEPEPEVVAWMDFANGGSIEDLEQALSAVAWTGEEAPMAEGPTLTADALNAYQQDVADSVFQRGIAGSSSDARGVRGGMSSRPHQRRRLPPGFRPRGYASWRPAHKMQWLSRHPNAARAPHPADPVVRRGARRAVPVRRAVRGPVVARPVAARPLVRRPVRGLARTPSNMAAFRAGKSMASRPLLRRTRMGALEEAIEETAEEMGLLPGTISADAFSDLNPSGLTRSTILESDAVDDLIEAEDLLDDEDDEEDGDEGTTSEAIRQSGPQFGAIFKRKTEDRLESARRRYERLRDRAVTKKDWVEVEGALNDYRKLAQAYKKAAVAPTPVSKERALADLEQQPLFHSSAVARFQEAGGSIGDFPVSPGEDDLELEDEETLWSSWDEGDDI